MKCVAKDILTLIEMCMKNLEKADSIVLPPGDSKQRKRRKDLVDSFNVRSHLH